METQLSGLSCSSMRRSMLSVCAAFGMSAGRIAPGMSVAPPLLPAAPAPTPDVASCARVACPVYGSSCCPGIRAPRGEACGGRPARANDSGGAGGMPTVTIGFFTILELDVPIARGPVALEAANDPTPGIDGATVCAAASRCC